METVKLSAVLWRCLRAQALLEPVESVEKAAVAAAGIYGAAPTTYLSCAARVRDFAPEQLDRALFERRSLVRVPAMRGSIYLLPPELVPHGLALADQGFFAAFRTAGVTEASYAGLASSIEALLRERPKTVQEIRAGLTTWRERVPGTLNLLLRQMSHDSRIVRGRVRGGWRSQEFEYALLKDWVPMPAKLPTVIQALQRLAPLYFAAHGPATLADFAWWAGVSELTAKSALERLELENVFMDKLRGIHLATRESLDQLSSAPAKWDSLKLLPYWDAYVMAHADRHRYLDSKWEDRVVDPGGNVTNVILRAGRVAGVWDHQGTQLRFAPFEMLRAQAVRGAAAPFARLLEVRDIVEARSTKPLSAKGQNAFQSPISM